MVSETVQSRNLQTRPPVVVVLGHVDHGKTKLLDTIRKTKVMEGESGGITQHIGAYQASIPSTGSGQATKTITFLDTPGHEAFTAIRSRGARVADVAILVVAADESIKPQTKEAIRIIKEEDMPFIVAINKIDKDTANPQKVRQDLASEDVLVEDWGGKVPVVEISARDGRNIDALLDMILLVAELEELTADPGASARGVIIESHLDKWRGYVATALVQDGTLRVGDWIVVGRQVGKVKSMEDFNGAAIAQAHPSQPVLITGWSDAPDIGKPFATATDKGAAEDLRDENITLAPLLLFLKQPTAPDEKKKTLNIVFKTDVSSSLEALDATLGAIHSDEVAYKVLDYGVGNITEGDVQTAAGSKASIFGFRVGVEGSAKKAAEKAGITIATFDIIYELIEAVRKEMGAMLTPEIKRTSLGKLRVLKIFKKDARAIVCGGKVTSGIMRRGILADVTRMKAVVLQGKIGQLQQNKDDVAEVKEGLECGIRLDISGTPAEVKEGDILEAYEEERIERSL